MIRAATVLFAFANAGFACEADGERLTPEVNDAPSAFVSHGEVPLAQPFSMDVILCDPGRARLLKVDAIMPAHQHGMNYLPQITDTGQGIYKVDGMLFHMPGLWEVRVTAQVQDEVMNYTYVIVLQ